jgi:hypothetical protein
VALWKTKLNGPTGLRLDDLSVLVTLALGTITTLRSGWAGLQVKLGLVDQTKKARPWRGSSIRTIPGPSPRSSSIFVRVMRGTASQFLLRPEVTDARTTRRVSRRTANGGGGIAKHRVDEHPPVNW